MAILGDVKLAGFNHTYIHPLQGLQPFITLNMYYGDSYLAVLVGLRMNRT